MIPKRNFEITEREATRGSRTIQYQAGNVTGHGALVWNEKVSGKRPLLLVMPNWLGVTEIAIKRAAEDGRRQVRRLRRRHVRRRQDQRRPAGIAAS